MLELRNIVKDYDAAGEKVHALKNINLKFRRSEFVAVLGPSGCGKTTLLNIIGGLDRYTDGDLIIEGRSTKEFKGKDWDTYRNHSVGFIFQSYHLIPHQTILQNVELALTIAGVSKKERRERALDALDRVGLKDRANNKPNQLSGGQAQRVAIARALINEPEIVLADEPTGALDSKTSVQIMDLLKEIAKDRLVIMVTHNPELAGEYATRTISVLDGEVTDDTMPYDGEDEDETENVLLSGERGTAVNKGRKKNSSMSFGMAMGLSFKNLISKGRRTTLVAFAGSIGIIGVSLVLAISAGVQAYITKMEDDMLSGYPVSVTRSALDFSSLTNMSTAMAVDPDITKLDDRVYVDSLLQTLSTFSSTLTTVNNISDAYVSYVMEIPEKYYNAITFDYEFDMSNNIYTDFYVTEGEKVSRVADSANASANLSITAIREMYASVLSQVEDYASYASMVSSMDSISEMMDNYDYIMSQYDVICVDEDGEAKTEGYSEETVREAFGSPDSLILVLDDGEVSDMNMAQYGYFSEEAFLNYAFYYMEEGADNYNPEVGLQGSAAVNEEDDSGFEYGYFVGDNAQKFTWYSNDCIYQKKTQTDGDVYFDYKASEEGGSYTVDVTYGNSTFRVEDDVDGIDREDGEYLDLGVKLILQKKEGVSYGALGGGMYYTHALTEKMLESAARSEIVNYINENGDLAQITYYYNYSYVDGVGDDGLTKYVLAQDMYYLLDSGGSGILSSLLGGSETMDALRISAAYLGGSSIPIAMYIYPTDFNCKEYITDYLDEWTAMCNRGETYGYTSYITGDVLSVSLSDGDVITYTDTVGLIIGLINVMIQMVTIALICFTGLSLIVSTVMIGIITYVSVVERIKEIGILRAVGARKRDIRSLFNSETFMIGLTAGVIGIAVTYLASLIINLIVNAVAGIASICALPLWEAGIMILVSIVLTLISGLIPASSAANKDPVVALRTE